MAIIIKGIRPAIVEYWDLCEHQGTSSDEFFSKDGLIPMRACGMVMEDDGDDDTPSLVKILFIEDMDGHNNGSGLVLPRSVIKKIHYLQLDDEDSSDRLKDDIN